MKTRYVVIISLILITAMAVMPIIAQSEGLKQKGSAEQATLSAPMMAGTGMYTEGAGVEGKADIGFIRKHFGRYRVGLSSRRLLHIFRNR